MFLCHACHALQARDRELPSSMRIADLDMVVAPAGGGGRPSGPEAAAAAVQERLLSEGQVIKAVTQV